MGTTALGCRRRSFSVSGRRREPLTCPGQARAGAPPTAAEAKAFVDDADSAAAEARDRDVPGRLGEVHVHHGRHGGPRGAGQRAADHAADRSREAGHALRPVTVPDDVRRRKLAAQAGARPARSARSQEAEELARLVAALEGTYGKGKWCRPGPDGKEECLDIDGHRAHHGHEPRPPRPCATPGWAGTRSRRRCARTSPATSSSPTRARRSWASRTWRDVALEVRHAARRLREGGGPALGAGEAALRLAARLRAPQAAREVRRRGARRRARSPRTCWATCGRRAGTTSIRWSRPRTPIRATT